MSLSDTQALSPDSPTDVDTNTVTYTRRYGDETKSAFSVAGITPPAEKMLTVSHETGKNGEHRALTKIDITVVDAFGVPATGSAKFTFVRPSNTGLTDAVMIAAINCLIDFLIEGGSNGNVTKLLNKEV